MVRGISGLGAGAVLALLAGSGFGRRVAIVDDGYGRDRAAETGLSHLAHATCCTLFLLAFELRGMGGDDRPLSVREDQP